jgi:hypothetical protein
MPFRSRSYGADQGCFYSQTVAGFEPSNFDPYWMVLTDR